MKNIFQRVICLFVTVFVATNAVALAQDDVLVALSGNNGRFISSQNGNAPAVCNRFDVYDWEVLQIIELEDGRIALLGSNNLYLTLAEDGELLEFTSEQIGEKETFLVVDLNGQIALKGSNGKYLSSENGAKSMTCNRVAIGPWERFRVEVLETLGDSVE